MASNGAAAARKVLRVKTQVVDPKEMDDETFFKHYNARHLEDIEMVAPIRYHQTLSASMIAAYRAFHNRCHAQGDVHDHDHN